MQYVDIVYHRSTICEYIQSWAKCDFENPNHYKTVTLIIKIN